MVGSQKRNIVTINCFVLLCCLASTPLAAQQILGAITGTVKDSAGASVPGATVKAINTATNLGVTAKTEANGSYLIPNLPAGTYTLAITKEGFETESHSEVLVNSDRTTTINGSLQVGAVATTVSVSAVALMNQVDATNGYVVDSATIQETPLATGSFTQLAIMSPGVHADFVSGAGANAGLGNQGITANGQRETSNSFSLNGISTNNLFNGNSTSQVGENRFVLNTGESFGAGGSIQSVSVYNAIGQALPTPPVEAIQEISVNAAMYDATQGANSGAHISVITKSGTNEIHGTVYEKFQNSDMNAAPFFYNASPAITDKVPFLNRNQFGAVVGRSDQERQALLFPLLPGRSRSGRGRSHQGCDGAAGSHQRPQRAGHRQRDQQRLRHDHYCQPDQSAPRAGDAAGQAAQRTISDPERADHQSGQAKALGYDAIVQGPNPVPMSIRESPTSTT